MKMVEVMPEEDTCLNCKHREGKKTYYTISCVIWTPRLYDLGYDGRLPTKLKCQHWVRNRRPK